MDNFFQNMLSSFWKLLNPILLAFLPLFIGLVLAYLLNPLVCWFKKRHLPPVLCTYLLVILSVCGLIYGFIILIIGSLPKGDLQNTVGLVEDYFNNASSEIKNFLAAYMPVGDGSSMQTFESLQNWFWTKFSFNSIIDTVSSLAGILVTFFLGIVISVYLLKDKEFFLELWQKFLSVTMRQKTHGLVNETMSEINLVITTFIKGAFVDSLIVAFLSSVVLTVIGVNYAVIIGIIGGILNIIPYFGPFFGMIPAFAVAFFDNGIGQGILAVLGLFLVQQLDSNFIYPKIVGSTTGLHPLFVLLSVSILGYFFGIWGMIFAVPVAGILQIFIGKWAYSKV